MHLMIGYKHSFLGHLEQCLENWAVDNKLCLAACVIIIPKIMSCDSIKTFGSA